MEHWKRTIERANRCFAEGELVDAREHYLQALALAQVLFERWSDADEAVAACVISHHNLADLHLRLNQPEESVEYLRFKPELREAALRHSSKTYVELLNFISEHGEYPRSDLLLKNTAAQSSRALSTTSGHIPGVH